MLFPGRPEKEVTYKELVELDTFLVKVEQGQQRARRKEEIGLPSASPTERLNIRGEKVALNGKVVVEAEENL